MRRNADDVMRDIEMMQTVYGPPPIEEEMETGDLELIVESWQAERYAGPAPGSWYRVNGSEFSIGRGPDNDMRIADQRISRQHARLFRVNGGWMIECMSVNWITVDGVACKKDMAKAIHDGSCIELPGLRLRVCRQESSRRPITLWDPGDCAAQQSEPEKRQNAQTERSGGLKGMLDALRRKKR